MVQAVESKVTATGASKQTSESPAAAEPVKPSHLHLVDETNDPNVRVGQRLKTARTEKGLSIDDVAKQIKFRKEYLDAIERMQVTQLPKGLVNPYVRDYARFLGLDTRQCVDDFNFQCGALSQASDLPAAAPEGPKDWTGPIKIGVTAVIAVLMGVGIWSGYQMFSQQSNSSPRLETSPSIVVTPDLNGAGNSVMKTAAPAVIVPADTVSLEVRAKERAWIEIRGADGTVFVDRRFSKGEVYDLRVGAGWTLTTPDAGAFEWIVNGETDKALGETDQAIYTMSVDEVAATYTHKDG